MGLAVSENELADQIVPAEIQLIKKKEQKTYLYLFLRTSVQPPTDFKCEQ